MHMAMRTEIRRSDTKTYFSGTGTDRAWITDFNSGRGDEGRKGVFVKEQLTRLGE